MKSAKAKESAATGADREWSVNGLSPCKPSSGSRASSSCRTRIEIRSYGCLPNGITVKQLSVKHDSKPVNPLIAGAFHRTGAVEVWSRGTNRVIALCRKHGAAPPTFNEQSGFLTVTFKAQIVAGGAAGTSRAGTPQVTQQPAEVPPHQRGQTLCAWQRGCK